MANTDEKKDDRTAALDFTAGLRDETGKLYKFTVKESAFVHAYLTDAKFVATTAAKMAGFDAKTDLAFRVIACQLMKKPHIIAAINAAFEALAMPKFEVIYRLGDVARGSIEDVINEKGQLDIEAARGRGTLGLIKKVKIKRTSKVVESVAEAFGLSDPRGDIDADETRETLETHILFEEISFEIHDPLRAMELLGKHGKLFTEKIEQTGADGKPLIPESAHVAIYLPDNQRGDTSADVLATAGKPKRSKTTRTMPDEPKDA
jgi:hypothetical protein